MEVFRIAKKSFVHDLSGTGARLYGGRWNSKGHNVVYTSGSRSLAMLESLVNIPLSSIVPVDYCIASIFIEDGVSMKEITLDQLPDQWCTNHRPKETIELGTSWLESRDSLILKVPSVVVHEEFNILINPHHPEFDRVAVASISRCDFDQRLFS